MKLSFSICILMICSAWLFSCAHKDIELSPSDKVSWDTKGLLKQNNTGQVNNISIDVLAVRGQKLRLDVTATLGFKVASIVLDKDRIQALIPPEKKFYDGFVTTDVMTRLVKIPAHPNVFYAMIFDQGLRGNGWACKNDEHGLIKECTYKDMMLITWERLEGSQKIVHLKTKSVEFDWLFKSQNSNWEPKPEMFSLTPPDSYQVIRL